MAMRHNEDSQSLPAAYASSRDSASEMDLNRAADLSMSADLSKATGLSSQEFLEIADLAESRFGLHLAQGKEMLALSRLRAPMMRLGIESFSHYVQLVKNDPNGELMSEFVEVLTTNHTHFFREANHFNFFLDAFANRPNPPKVWSAACATGDEPYTLGIQMREHWGPLLDQGTYILASDISRRAIRNAVAGIFPQARLSAVPEGHLAKYFLRGEGEWAGAFRIKRELFSFIKYQLINLVTPLPEIGKFDAIFCRNVMIYFTAETRKRVVHQLKTKIHPGGYLFVGHSESLGTTDTELKFCQPAVYQYLGPRS
jgi:chemotaxis protein methyltransferase CheR